MCRLVPRAVAGFATSTRGVVSTFAGWDRMCQEYPCRMAHSALVVDQPVAESVGAWSCSAADSMPDPQGYGLEQGKRLACLPGIDDPAESFARLLD